MSHSLTGLDWGNISGGAVQLVLALLSDHFGELPNGDKRVLAHLP